MSDLRKLFGQTAIYGLSSVLGRLLNYLLVPLYTRVFMPEEYGVVTELYAYATFLIIIFTYGLETAFFRFTSKEENPEKVYTTGLISLVISSLSLLGLILLFIDPISTALRYSAHKEYITWFAMILGLDAIASLPFARLRFENKAMKFVTIRLLNMLVNIGLNLYFLLLCPWWFKQYGVHLPLYDPAVGVGYVFISNLATSLLTLVFLWKELFGVRWTFNKGLWKRMIVYSLPLLVGGLAGMTNETVDRVLLKFLLPFSPRENMAQLGIYGACYKLSILMTLAIQAYRMAAEPFFFRLHKEQDVRVMYARAMNYFVIVCSLIFLGVMLHIDIIKHFIDRDYHSGLHVVPVLLMSNLWLGLFLNLSIWYKLSDRTIFGTLFTVAGAVLTIILNIWWIPVYGYTGSAWTTLICHVFMTIACYAAGQYYYPIRYNLKKIGFYLVAVVLIYLLSLYMSGFISGSDLYIRQAILTAVFLIFATVVFILEKPRKLVTGGI